MASATNDRWIDMEEIGGGAYGVVFRARDRRKMINFSEIDKRFNRRCN